MHPQKTNDPEAKFAITINFFLFLFLLFPPQLYLRDLFNCRVLNVKSEEKRFILLKAQQKKIMLCM